MTFDKCIQLCNQPSSSAVDRGYRQCGPPPQICSCSLEVIVLTTTDLFFLVLSFLEFCISKSFIVSSFVSGFFHVASCLWDSSLLLFVAVINFLLLRSSPLCDFTAVCSCTHQSMDIWLVSSFWLVRIQLLWTFEGSLFLQTHVFISLE